MTTKFNASTRFWGDQAPPKSKAEFFNAVTTPAQSGGGTVATIRMYGPIDSWGGWWGISTKDIGEVLDGLPETVTQIILRINSPGGEVFEAVSILNMLRAHKASVTAVVDGLAASAASVIAAGCDEAVMSPGTQMMIHSPLVFAYGNASELRKVADVLDVIETSIIDIYEAKAGENNWATLLAEDTWMTAKDAVELGLADRVAVIPDAGETETVGADQIVVVPVEEDDPEDAVRMRPVAAADFLAAHKPPSSPEPGQPNKKEALTMSDTFLAGVRERLGMTDAEATEEAVMTALEEALTAPTAPTATAKLPEGVVAIDAAVLAGLKAQAAEGAAARAEQTEKRREGILDAALADGRIAPTSREHFAKLLAADEESTVALLDSMPKNTAVHVAVIGKQPADTADSELDRAAAAAGWDDDDTKEA